MGVVWTARHLSLGTDVAVKFIRPEQVAADPTIVARGDRQFDGDDDAPAVTQRWKLRLLNCNAAATEILDELSSSGKENTQVGKDCPVHDAITYLDNNGHRMRYASARRRGLPIGSGNVEATCKTLVGQRMKRCGSRRKTATGDHVLHLRALSLSDRWSDAMNITLRAKPVRIQVA